MTQVDTSLRPFVPGTTGWSAADLDGPEIERLWFQGRHEIIDGVLTTMAPAFYAGHGRLLKLILICWDFVRAQGLKGSFVHEADIIIDESRVVRADAVYLTTEDKKHQEVARKRAGKSDPNRTRILIPPTLIIESVSMGHEQHDRRTKLRWYAEFGVKNYWILDPIECTLECRVLEGKNYRLEVSGKKSDEIRPSLFPGLHLSLPDVWQD
jgi:Uma2 family endonuclease